MTDSNHPFPGTRHFGIRLGRLRVGVFSTPCSERVHRVVAYSTLLNVDPLFGWLGTVAFSTSRATAVMTVYVFLAKRAAKTP